ncbi:carbohydrate ABC transporter membrane protein 2, CUT1 family [Anaerolinea thermolimosa]|uniref:Carbohydrate ABC transporter membrane protein 2, CUT1 family n=2 Tax=Anaerolinea thermolimosa TaxID=229919 RepID=A0A7U9KNN6_9CHLR|nr:carbohydrate ABC transporter permease [Anaerolinea thermolimosa]GAP08323.1 carbohydrate ABC transporter membrane protein 2, CUT1 family [Anaerolinea thermolimosa]
MMRFLFPRRTSSLVPNYIIVLLLVIFAIGPLVILVFNSLKTPADAGRNLIGFPREIILSNYPRAWVVGQFGKTLPNTLILVAGTVVATLILSGMAAYSIAKLNLPGSGILTMYMLISSSLPIQLFLVPLFFLWRKLGLVNNLLGLIIIYVATNAPFSIFLLRSYMIQIPSDFEDAARVDGAGEWDVFQRVVVPLAWPAFLTVGLVVGLSVWNEYLLATVFLTKQELFTVVTSYYNFSTAYGGRDWGLTSAGAVMMIFPLVVLFLLMQRRFIEGLTQGGLKG